MNTTSTGMDDIFLKIIAGEIPATKIYEDEHTVAFLDINPNNKGHALVIPRTKYRNIYDADSTALSCMMVTAQKVARAQKEALGADGVNIVMNNEAPAGQEVFHAHIHVIPRFTDDGIFAHSKHTAYAEGEMQTIADKIKEVLT